MVESLWPPVLGRGVLCALHLQKRASHSHCTLTDTDRKKQGPDRHRSHNVLAQLVGRKRMLLWPPLALPDLHLYPATHTAFRQSQVPLGAAAAAAAQPPGSPAARAMATLPGFASAGLHAAVGVDLEPGDCVYIPPYWGHGVYSVEPSVSLASFSNSWEQARWATISSAI